VQPNNPYDPNQPVAPPPAPPPYDPTLNQNATPQPHDYSFILNPEKPTRKRGLPGSSSSMLVRIGIVAGGLLILLIIFSILKSALAGHPNTTGFITAAQEQQELIHLSTNASQQTGLSTTNLNSALTTQLSLTSGQHDILAYLQNNHVKVKTKLLNLQVSKTLDEQLTTAAAASTYNQTFHDVMKSKLTAYALTLKQTYAHTKGPKGRALLSQQYDAAQLLLQQLDTPATT